jgi:hypothetical protein
MDRLKGKKGPDWRRKKPPVWSLFVVIGGL